MNRFIIVSGLPASGKTTLGKAIALAMGLPLLDKDEIIESLFATLGVGDAAWRALLSRAADGVLQRLAMRAPGAVIVSWWHHPQSSIASGTSTDWLHELPGRSVEIHCQCSPAVAVERFFARQRHAGHLDHLKSKLGELPMFEQVHALGPLGLTSVVVVNTERPYDLDKIVKRIDSIQ